MSLRWVQSDIEPLWIANNKDPVKRRLIEHNEWTADSITYKFNSEGFRSDEFEGEGAVFLGCSFTFGVGMDWERTWAYRVAKQLGLKCWNLGLGGSSNDTAFRLASYWIPLLKPKYVFYLQPEYTRFELFVDGQLNLFLPNTIPMPDQCQSFAELWMANDPNPMLNRMKNLFAIRHICEQNNIPLYNTETAERFKEIFVYDFARDCVHFGPKWNEATANYFLEIMKK